MFPGSLNQSLLLKRQLKIIQKQSRLRTPDLSRHYRIPAELLLPHTIDKNDNILYHNSESSSNRFCKGNRLRTHHFASIFRSFQLISISMLVIPLFSYNDDTANDCSSSQLLDFWNWFLWTNLLWICEASWFCKV